MTAPIRICTDHGAFSAGRESGGENEGCPVCDASGTRLLSGDRRRRLSKFMSGALRHFPDNVALDLDERGWAASDDLVAAVDRQYDWARPRHVAAVIATDPKGRFERHGSDATELAPATGDDSGDDTGNATGGRVRASYGHSVDVDLQPTAAPVPAELYHGTAPDNEASIREAGLQPMDRQQVHLSASPAAARGVGRRHAADPVVFTVDAAAMLADGCRITKRGRETYTTDAVPPEYLAIREA